ncbi:MAG: hypothetical protein F4Z15_01045 [Gammaproteobacteria bacterium]|nr:hypothetical protein [Gammaproteobacteria bacterium]MYD75108.1 hypothetical protein [Gammaproteobacteria bacterium]
MATYLIVLTDNAEGVLETIETEWPDRYYKINDEVIMVSAQGVSAPSQIAEKIGFATEPDAPSGMVLSMNQDTAAGVLPRAAVDWYRSSDND